MRHRVVEDSAHGNARHRAKRQAIKSPADQGEIGGARGAGPGEGSSLRGRSLQGMGEISDRRCICRELYDHSAHGWFVKIPVKKP